MTDAERLVPPSKDGGSGETGSSSRLAEIQARADAATPGPWFYNSYCAISSRPKIGPEDEWWTARENDGHSYDHRIGQVCDACGPRFTTVGSQQLQVWDCQLAPEALDIDSDVAWVHPFYGDTATGQRMLDAEFIAAAREDIPWLLAEVQRLTDENERLGARIILDVAESQLVKDMQGDLDALQACIDAAKALHRQVPQFQSQPVCSNCVTVAGEPAWWPCATVRALDGTPEP